MAIKRDKSVLSISARADIRAANLAAATINREVNNPSLRSGAGELCMAHTLSAGSYTHALVHLHAEELEINTNIVA